MCNFAGVFIEELVCVCVCVRVCWPLPISISFSFLIHRHRRHRSASRRRGRLLAARFLFSVLRRRRRLRSSPNDEPVCFFFLFFLITKKRSIVVSMADRWRILATRNGKPLLFVFVLFPFFFVYCWSEPSPSTVIIESNGRAVKSRGVARNAAPPLDGHRRRRRRPRRRSIADRISSSFIVSGFRQSERERDK